MHLSTLVKRLAVAGAAAAVLAVAAASAWFFSSGGIATTVATPSMSPTLQVGSLALAMTPRGPVTPGQVIVFRPPGDAHTYVHRVAAVVRTTRGTVDGYRTEGDAVGRRDPWLVPPGNVRGVVVTDIPVLGWLPSLAPILVASLVAAGALAIVERRLKRWIVVDIACIAVLLASLEVHLFVRWSTITVTHTLTTIHIRVANTGLLPIRLAASTGSTLHLAPGHFGTISAPAGRLAMVTGTFAPAPDTLVLLVAACMAPLVLASAMAWKASRHEAPAHP